MDKKKDYEITIKISAQQIEDIAQQILNCTHDCLIDSRLPRTKEIMKLVLSIAIEEIENCLADRCM